MANSFSQYLDARNNPNMDWGNENDPMEYQQNMPPSYDSLLGNRPSNFKKGGKVRKKNLRTIAETIRAKGREGDTILAHINPQEAQMLYEAGGSGTINPETGLPEFWPKGGFLANPIKAITKGFQNPGRSLLDLATIAATVYGGPVGGAIAGGARAAVLKKPILLEALKGAGYGAAAGAAGNLAGMGLSKLGMEGAGQALQNYGTQNMGSWAGNAYQMGEGVSGLGNTLGLTSKAATSLGSLGGGNSSQQSGIDINNLTKEQFANLSNAELANIAARKQYMDQLVPKTFSEKAMGYLSKPETMMTLGTTGLSMYNNNQMAKEAKADRAENKIDRELNREILKGKVEKSPEEEAGLKKRFQAAMKKTPAEIEENERYLQLLMGKSDSDLLEQALDRTPPRGRFVKQHTPEEFARTGKWFSYYDNPEFKGLPLFKEGGPVMEKTIIEVIKKPRSNHVPMLELFKPQIENLEPHQEQMCGEMNNDEDSIMNYLGGETGGQDDKIPAMLSDGEYIIDASTVSDLGDGNNKAGAKKLDIAIKKIRKHKRGGTLKLPPKAKNITDYFKGN